jgi:hypothetical protein
MYARIVFWAILCAGMASANTLLIVPTEEIFLNVPNFDQVDVYLQSPNAGFANDLPLDLTGPGTVDWSSFLLTDQHASAVGPALTGLDHLVLNLATKTDPVKLVVEVRFRGGQVRLVQMSYDGTDWSLSLLPLGGNPLAVSLNTGTGNGTFDNLSFGLPDSGGGPPGVTGAANPAPEPSPAGLAGLALLALALATRWRRIAA